MQVSDPQRHGDFVDYLVSTGVRRRFQDFSTLHKLLLEAHPSCIIPPLPDKHRMEYLTGDRFSPEFLERRRIALENYLAKIARHPVLGSSGSFSQFLYEQSISQPADKQQSTVFDNLSDVFINAFAKIRKPDDQFIAIKDQVSKLEGNLTNVEKYHSKLLKAQRLLDKDYRDLGVSLTSLALVETQVSDSLNTFGTRLQGFSELVKQKTDHEDYEFVSCLKEYSSYCDAVKSVLKLRDQKQIDHEELSAWLTNHESDLDRTKTTGKSPGITGFFKDKINDFKGVDPEKARQERLEKLESKIGNAAVATSSDTAKAFSESVLKEVEYFNEFKDKDFAQFFNDYAKTQIEFHEKSIRFWDDLAPVLDELVLPPEPVSLVVE